MGQRRHHYDRAFEAYLRHRTLPYVCVNEARKALMPESTLLKVDGELSPSGRPATLKSFDFVMYGQPRNLLVDVKGRQISRRVLAQRSAMGGVIGLPPRTRLESWVTLGDIESLQVWQDLFGPEFAAAFVFIYWCAEQPPDALFQEVFDFEGRWYALRGVLLEDYVKHMKTRSLRWKTVDLPAAAFERISQPVGASWLGQVRERPISSSHGIDR